MIFQQNITGQIIEFWLAATDHLTGATGQSPTLRFAKNGATAFASATQAVTEMQYGWYKATLATNNVDTLGPLAIHATATKADDTDQEHQIGPIQVNTIWWASATIVAPNTAGVPKVDVTQILGVTATTGAAMLGVNVYSWATATGLVPTPTVVGRPLVDLSHINGTAATTGAAQLGVNVFSWATATGLVTVNVVGLPRVDLVDIAGVAVNTAAAQLGVNVIQAATIGWLSGAIKAAVFTADAIDANALAANAVAEIQLGLSTIGYAGVASAVWDEQKATHTATNSFGAIVQALGAAADPWSTALPGAYVAGSAGFIVGTNLDTTVSSRSTATVGPTATVIADTLLDRDMSLGADSGSSTVRTPRQALRILRNKISATATTGILSVFKEDDTTSSWTSQLQTDASATPITGSDPV